MGYALCTGMCAACRRLFSFNPVRVPSVRINGSRDPVCRECIEAANVERRARGLEPFPVAADAYEACDESELYG